MGRRFGKFGWGCEGEEEESRFRAGIFLWGDVDRSFLGSWSGTRVLREM